MKPTPPKILDEVLKRPRRCARHREREGCEGRLTIEHAFGRTKQKAWQLIWLCEKHHGLSDWANKEHFDKEKNKWHAYLQTTEDELAKEKLGEQMIQERKYLIEKYGSQHWKTTKTTQELSEIMRRTALKRYEKNGG